jgi:FkbM family methyltransferase
VDVDAIRLERFDGRAIRPVELGALGVEFSLAVTRSAARPNEIVARRYSRVVPAPPILSAFEPWEGIVEPGWEVNWLGVRTRLSVGNVRGFDAPTHVRTQAPEASEDLLEWITVLESVNEASDTFTMVELGAGWGRWLVNAAVALRRLDPARDVQLVGVEAEPTHFRWLVQHLRDNGLDPERHRLVQAAVAASDGTVRFQRGDAAAWYGQAIDADDPLAKLSGPVSRLIRWSRNSVANRLAFGRQARKMRRTRSVGLATLLEPHARVDLVDADVQGAEADVFEPAGSLLSAGVRRVHIGTHDRENERRLRVLFTGLGWECRFDYPSGTRCETDWGPVDFEDGVQSWINPALRPRG